MKLRHLLFLLLINLMWGLNMVAIKVTVEAVQPVTASSLRFLLVLGVCLPWLRWIPGRMTTVLLTSLLAGVSFMLLTHFAIAVATNVSALAIAGQLSVPFSLILAIIFLGERIAWVRATGIILSFVGVVYLGFDPAIVDERLGLLLTVAGSFVWAVSSLLFRRLAGVPPLTTYAWLALITTPILLLTAAIVEPGGLSRVDDAPLHVFAWIAFSAIGSTVIGHVGTAWLLQRYPVNLIAPLTLLSPLVAVISATIAFDTPITTHMTIGGLLILAGVAIITIRSAQKRGRHEPVL